MSMNLPCFAQDPLLMSIQLTTSSRKNDTINLKQDPHWSKLISDVCAVKNYNDLILSYLINRMNSGKVHVQLKRGYIITNQKTPHPDGHNPSQLRRVKARGTLLVRALEPLACSSALLPLWSVLLP